MIYVTGDTHGLIDVEKVSKYRFPDGEKLSKDDYLIICGDWGGLFFNNDRDKTVIDFWENKPYTVLWVDGNHENFDLINTYPVEEWNGGKVHFIRPTVIHLMRGQVYIIDGKKIFTFGGGLSIDKAKRQAYVSWWPQEEPSYAECNEALMNLDRYGNKVDYIITHACPQSIMRNELCKIRGLSKVECQTEKFLDTIFDTVEYQYWFCGHYHMDARIKAYNLEVLYRNIIKLSKGNPIASRH